MAIRCALAILVGSILVCCLGVACAAGTRYQVLSFFFDGVPVPGEDRLAEAASEEAQEAPEEPGEEKRRRRRARVDPIKLHPPYKRYECGRCHSMTNRLIGNTPQEGLCKQCHEDIPGDLRYVHGPVAVSDCLFCHHHHGDRYPKQLRDEPTAICLRCHNRSDLTEGSHHDQQTGETCIDCHHGHGLDNRFFLKKRDN